MLRKGGSQPRDVPRPERHGATPDGAAGRVGDADEPLPLRGLEQLHLRREPPGARLLAERQLLDEMCRSPRCRRPLRHDNDASRETVTGLCRLSSGRAARAPRRARAPQPGRRASRARSRAASRPGPVSRPRAAPAPAIAPTSAWLSEVKKPNATALSDDGGLDELRGGRHRAVDGDDLERDAAQQRAAPGEDAGREPGAADRARLEHRERVRPDERAARVRDVVRAHRERGGGAHRDEAGTEPRAGEARAPGRAPA